MRSISTEFLAVTLVLPLAIQCKCQDNHPTQNAPPASVVSAPQVDASAAPPVAQGSPPALAEPVRLVSMPVAAYGTSLALDDDGIFLLTSNAAYKLAPGQPPQGLQLDLGFGAVLTRSGFVFWHSGAVWHTAKHGGQPQRLTELPHTPQYFVTDGDNLAWVDRSEADVYSIQSLVGKKPLVLLTSETELSAVHMIRGAVYFVHKAADTSWRIGRINVTGGAPKYSASHTGPTPSLLTGSQDVFFYDLKTSEVRTLSANVDGEHAWLKDFVCSPAYEANNVYCGCVEGLFQISAEHPHRPKVLSHGRPGSITAIRADDKRVVWTVDTGPNQLAVDLLPLK